MALIFGIIIQENSLNWVSSHIGYGFIIPITSRNFWHHQMLWHGYPTQYGDGIAAWAVYLQSYQMLPLERIAQLFEDLTGFRPSEATLLSQLGRRHHALEESEQQIKTALFNEPVVHADETGFRVGGEDQEKTKWMHTISNGNWTLLNVHDNSGSQAMDELGFFPFYLGTVVHDCLQAYFKTHYYFSHVLCNAHLQRSVLSSLTSALSGQLQF